MILQCMWYMQVDLVTLVCACHIIKSHAVNLIETAKIEVH